MKEEISQGRAKIMATALVDAGYEVFFGVPCGILSPLFSRLDEETAGVVYAPREDTAIGYAAGAAMSGKRTLVLMQNSGFGQSVNALASLVVPYSMPISLLVSMRGVAPDNTPENQIMGGLTRDLLGGMGIPHRTVGEETLADDVDWVAAEASAAALLVEPELFEWSPSL